METCTLPGARNGFDGAAVFLNDAVGHGEPEPRAFFRGLGGKERIVDAAQMFGRDAVAGIDHFDDDAVFAVRG